MFPGGRGVATRAWARGLRRGWRNPGSGGRAWGLGDRAGGLIGGREEGRAGRRGSVCVSDAALQCGCVFCLLMRVGRMIRISMELTEHVETTNTSRLVSCAACVSRTAVILFIGGV